MPGVNPSNDRWLATTIKNILQRPPTSRASRTVACATPRTSCGAVGLLLMAPTAWWRTTTPETSALSSVSCLTVTLALPRTAQPTTAATSSSMYLRRHRRSGTISTASTVSRRLPEARPSRLRVRVGHHAHHAVGHPRTAEYCQRTVQSFAKGVRRRRAQPAPVWAHLSNTTTTPAVVGLQTTGAATALVTGLTQGSHTPQH